MDKETVNKHYEELVPMLRNPVAEYHFNNVSRQLENDRSWLPTGSLPEGLYVSTKLPDVDTMYFGLSGKVKLTQANLDHLPGKQGFLWLIVNNPDEIRFLKETYGEDVVFVSRNSKGQEYTYVKPSKLWRSGKLQAGADTVNTRKDANWNVETSIAGPTYPVEASVGPNTSIKLAVSRKVEVDLVFALEVSGWPLPAEPWKTRRRQWPNREVVQRIVREGHHVVPKPSPGGNPDTEWRISFSKAELILSKNMTQTQKNSYKFLKVIATEEFSNPKILCSYHLKTTFLWALEKLPSDYWSDSKIGERVLGLLDDLLGYLTSRKLPNYFIPEMNLLEGLSEREYQKARDQVSRVCQNPLSFPGRPWVFLIYNGLGFKFQDDIADYFLDPANKLEAWKVSTYTIWISYLIKVRAGEQIRSVQKKLEEEPALAKFAECLNNFTPKNKRGKVKPVREYLAMERNQAIKHYKSAVGDVNQRDFDLVMGSNKFLKDLERGGF